MVLPGTRSDRRRNRPTPEWLSKSQQVAVGVLHEKLAQASLLVTDPIPGVMRRTEQRPLCTGESINQRLKALDEYLKIDATPERALPVAGLPVASADFQHHLSAPAFEISEIVLRTAGIRPGSRARRTRSRDWSAGSRRRIRAPAPRSCLRAVLLYPSSCRPAPRAAPGRCISRDTPDEPDSSVHGVSVH
jgi:hypothetical protein